MTRDFSLRAWDPTSGYIVYDVLVSKGKVFTPDLNFYGHEKDLDLHRCTGFKDVSGKQVWEKDLVAAIIKDPESKGPLKLNTNFYWVSSTKQDGTFTKIFQVRYSVKNIGFYLFPFEASESFVKEDSCFYFNSSKKWEVAVKRLCSPNDLIAKAREAVKDLENSVTVRGVFE